MGYKKEIASGASDTDKRQPTVDKLKIFNYLKSEL